ncbi:MAG: AAA family ATPase [Pseudomonadota bacterium]
MIASFLRRWRASGWPRLLLIALAALFIGSAWLAPQWNPVTRFLLRYDPEVLGAVARGWNETAYARSLLAEHLAGEDAWPRRMPEDPVLDDAGAVFAFDLSEPGVLKVATSDGFPARAGLQGEVVRYRYDPRTRQWSCDARASVLPARLLPYGCDTGNSRNLIRDLLALLVVAALIAIAAAAWWLHRNPLLLALQRDPAGLLDVPLDDLHALDRALGWLRQRDAMLRVAGVGAGAWRMALGFDRALPTQKAEILALAIGAHSRRTTDWALPGDVFEWRMPEDLPVNLARCLLYVPETSLAPAETVRALRELRTGQDVLLILVPSVEAERHLSSLCRDPANLLVALDRRVQTRWLLADAPVDALVRAMARQLQVTRISPYQTRGGVSRPSSFYGRAQLLAQVVNREPGNYVLVGGRQLGKTSLMKAIQRRFETHPRVRCLYLALRDHRLAPRVASEAGLDPATDLDVALAALAAQSDGRALLLLIDEADLFLRHDAAHQYPELARLRALSEEGRCHFMLAGFWDVYRAATQDYQSPLRNFGEVIAIGGLEAAACRALATQPLERLGIAFQTPALVDALIEASGERANLVAILCQECLQALPPGIARIRHEHLQTAFASQAVQDALAGWARLTQDDAASRLDRIIVYRIAQTGAQRVADLVALLDAHRIRIEIETLRQSLARLRLAWVLRQDGDRYRFAVPLFERQFDPAELALFLDRELRAAGA